MKSQWKPIAVALCTAVLAILWWQRPPDKGHTDAESKPQRQTTQDSRTTAPPDKPSLLTSFSDVIAKRQSGLWMTSTVRIVKILSDDTKGSRHQRFLVEGRDGNTILVAHNIDLASRVPITKGDVLEIRGRYEWNEKGGVLHWTHIDPSGRQEGGWIRSDGRQYR